MRLRTAVLTLGFGLGVVGLVSAEEPASGGWFSRMVVNPFAKAPAEPKAEDAKKMSAAPAPVVSTGNRLLKAQGDWQRRQEVCLRLREIAFANNDEDLARKADQLDQRAEDAYIAATRGLRLPDRPNTTTESTKKEGRK